MKGEEKQTAFELGGLFTEMNTILARIRRRASGEPTGAERERLAELKAQIAELRRGKAS